MPETRSGNGWSIFFGEIFARQWIGFRARTRELKGSLPADQFAAHPDVKLFAALVAIVHEVVPQDPSAKEFRLGKSLGSHADWRRVKRHGLPNRWRLFFRFSSVEKVIVFVWLNDDATVRKEGAQTDVYKVFKAMLDAGQPPSDLDELLRKASVGT